MKLEDLIKVLAEDQKVSIDYNYERYTYRVYELLEDFVFYDEIKDREIKLVWYSVVYQAQVIEI